MADTTEIDYPTSSQSDPGVAGSKPIDIPQSKTLPWASLSNSNSFPIGYSVATTMVDSSLNKSLCWDTASFRSAGSLGDHDIPINNEPNIEVLDATPSYFDVFGDFPEDQMELD